MRREGQGGPVSDGVLYLTSLGGEPARVMNRRAFTGNLKIEFDAKFLPPIEDMERVIALCRRPDLPASCRRQAAEMALYYLWNNMYNSDIRRRCVDLLSDAFEDAPDIRGMMDFRMAEFRLMNGDHTAARPILEKIARTANIDRLRAWALLKLGESYMQVEKDAAESDRRLKTIYDRFKQTGAPYAWAALKLGENSAAQGDTAAARAYFLDGWDHWRFTGQWKWATINLMELSAKDGDTAGLTRLCGEIVGLGLPVNDDVRQAAMGHLYQIERSGGALPDALKQALTEHVQMFRVKDPVRDVRVSSVERMFLGKFAVDGETATRWASEQTAPTAQIDIEFKKPLDLAGIEIVWEVAAAERYDVRVSEDGRAWRTAASVGDGMSNERRRIAFPPARCRFLRIDCLKKATPCGYSIWEVNFLPGGGLRNDDLLPLGLEYPANGVDSLFQTGQFRLLGFVQQFLLHAGQPFHEQDDIAEHENLKRGIHSKHPIDLLEPPVDLLEPLVHLLSSQIDQFHCLPVLLLNPQDGLLDPRQSRLDRPRHLPGKRRRSAPAGRQDHQQRRSTLHARIISPRTFRVKLSPDAARMVARGPC